MEPQYDLELVAVKCCVGVWDYVAGQYTLYEHTYSSRYRSDSPVVSRGWGRGHREGRAGLGHMIHTKMGDWPTGLMT